jgi:hypothetical protein
MSQKQELKNRTVEAKLACSRHVLSLEKFAVTFETIQVFNKPTLFNIPTLFNKPTLHTLFSGFGSSASRPCFHGV